MKHNLPKPATPFVGREAEIESIRTLLNDTTCRLVSLVGAGGMGKTRLALAVANDTVDLFNDGTYFVMLQSVTSSDALATVIASAIGFEFNDDEDDIDNQLLAYLNDRQLLLILDNFEHLLPAVDFVMTLLRNASQVKLLVTSREPLKLRQEWVRPVLGMLVPDELSVSDGLNYSAIRLFINRARQLRNSFVIEDELPHIIHICQLLDGMPLGIELAAAWVNTLSCAEIATELTYNIDLLTTQMHDMPERHHSMRAIFASTWSRLSPDEKVAFMRISVFRDTPTRQAIQSVTGAGLVALSGLVDKALLISLEDGRYQIHSLLQQFASEALNASDDEAQVRDAHSRYYLNLLQARQADIQGRRQVEVINRIKLDFENIRVAWQWAVKQMDYESICGAVETLCMYLHLCSRWKQESHLLTYAQKELASNDEIPHPVWAMVAARNFMNHDKPLEILQLALDIACKQNNKNEIGLCYHLMGHYSNHQHRYQDAIEYYEQSIPYFENRDMYHLAASYGFAATQYRLLGDYKTSVEYNEISLKLRRENGDLDGQMYATTELANSHFIIGDLEVAENYRREAILLAEQLGSRWSILALEWELALYDYAFRRGDLSQMMHLTQQANSIYEHLSSKGITVSLAYSRSLQAAITEQYDEAHHYGLIALEDAKEHVWLHNYSIGLLMALCGRHDYEAAQQQIRKMLEHFSALRVIPYIFLSFPIMAVVSAYKDNDPYKATCLVALASNHPSSMSGWLDAWALIDRLKVHLQQALDESTYQQACEEGRNLQWETVVAEFLVTDDTTIQQNSLISAKVWDANTALPDPLSERELEVLLHIGQGLTNREIASQLSVELSTVKKHITHIYSKLDVKNRTQALITAQEKYLI
ncbi:MAG: LuxR C-terminal-related transcriptional regulator [Chloroflexota bacterium]